MNKEELIGETKVGEFQAEIEIKDAEIELKDKQINTLLDRIADLKDNVAELTIVVREKDEMITTLINALRGK